MIDQFFLFDVITAFFVGGAAISIAILIAEKFGTKIGALFLSLPITTTVSLFFIATTQGTDFLVDAVPHYISGLVLFLLFITIYIFSIKKTIFPMTLSIIVWLIGSSLFFFFPQKNFFITGVILILVYLIINLHFRNSPNETKDIKKIRHSKKLLVLKFLTAGGTIAAALIVAQIGGPIAGGIMSAFPATTISALYLLKKEHDLSFIKSIAKRMIYYEPSLLVYAFAVMTFYPTYGLVFGTLISWAVTLTVALSLYLMEDKVGL